MRKQAQREAGADIGSPKGLLGPEGCCGEGSAGAGLLGSGGCPGFGVLLGPVCWGWSAWARGMPWVGVSAGAGGGARVASVVASWQGTGVPWVGVVSWGRKGVALDWGFYWGRGAPCVGGVCWGLFARARGLPWVAGCARA